MENSRDTTLRILAQRAVRELREQKERIGDRGSGGSSVIRLVNCLIAFGIERSASDIHIEPQEDGIRLRYRSDGLLCEYDETLSSDVISALVSRIKVMAGMDIAQHQKPQDGHIRYSVNAKELDIRVSILPALYGETVVMRLMNMEDRLLQLHELGFSAGNEAAVRTLIHKPAGLLLLCGPMNSGKTTTLYAAMSELNETAHNLVTLEDPIERVLPGINQVQLNPKAGLTYPVGLRTILRQDAETILLGEIRDEETAEMAVRIALTGHLIMTTLHTENAVSAIYRLLEMGVAPYLLAATLSGIVAQRLVRRICPKCKGIGCPTCHESGYYGRVALQEVLSMDDTLRDAILKRDARQTMEGLARRNGMKTLWEDGKEKISIGATTQEEVRRVLYGVV